MHYFHVRYRALLEDSKRIPGDYYYPADNEIAEIELKKSILTFHKDRHVNKVIDITIIKSTELTEDGYHEAIG
jgi:hypothetical protein